MDVYPVLTTVALALVLPYVTGTMVHHFLARNWEKAIGWLLLFLFCLTTGLATLAIAAVESGEPDPNVPFVDITPWVMLGQAVLWGILGIRRSRTAGGWRTVAIIACLISLAVGLLLPATYNAIHRQRIAQDRQILDEACYFPYPGAEFPDGHGKYKHRGGPGFGRLVVNFITDDDPELVFGFYAQHAGDAGLRVRRGTSNWDGTQAQWAVGIETMAIEVTQEDFPGEWTFTVYFGIYSSFEEDYIEENYDLAP